MATDSDSGGRRGFAAYLPLIVALLVMPGVAYLTLKYLPELKTLQRQAADASTNQPSAKPTNQFKLLKQKAAPRMPVPIADGQLGFDPDVSKEPGPVRLVLTNAPNVSNFTMTLRLADRNRPRHALVELFMLGENTDELIAKANLANSKDPGLYRSITNRLSGKTADNLLKPGSRNVLRTELLALCNQLMGSNTVHEILITALVVQ
ncbi:MAG: flagellar basal body-associated FliL family protein [Verrucomicrobia bacterium]|nr:flagellar basal body-associated FliL family protein [Verrucomicrobiota bacterium]